ASFWASIATLWGAAGAWFTFVLAAVASRRQTREGVLNLIAGIEAELGLIENWARGKEGDRGYLKSDTASVLAHDHPDWFYPNRHVYTFDSPTLNNFTSSSFMAHLKPVVPALIDLSYSVHRLMDFLTTNYNPFVSSDPANYQEVVRKLSTGTTVASLTPPEQTYAKIVFGMNMTVHQDLIGGADSNDRTCLYKAFRGAKDVIGNFKTTLRIEPLPRWYWILTCFAIWLIAIGLVEVFRWFNVCRFL
ncbi:MAG: hypothetical protein WA153_09825, partial [Candidatus Acidiferrales bacterium]